MRRGAYILLLRLARDEEIEVGRLGVVRFRRGEYGYVGSALGGLDARIARHLRAEKKRHWHIDYVLERASVTGVLEFEGATRIECRLSDALAGSGASTTPVQRFGSSDCRCLSHLHYFGQRDGAAEVAARSVAPQLDSGIWRPA
ncbi:MAG: GIY-YIG nuclease family protein [Dehalococcoidia bacterium]